MKQSRVFLAIALVIHGGGWVFAQVSPEPPAAVARKFFSLRSPAVADGGQLPKDYTGDGERATLPLEWNGAPDETKSYAVIMHHVAPDKLKWYWILYNIPAEVKSLPKNVKGIGTLGNNSVTGKVEYAPPHSRGPGAKTYIYTVYALSAQPKITVPPAEVSREVLLKAMTGLILERAELYVTYTRFPEPTALLLPGGALKAGLDTDEPAAHSFLWSDFSW